MECSSWLISMDIHHSFRRKSTFFEFCPVYGILGLVGFRKLIKSHQTADNTTHAHSLSQNAVSFYQEELFPTPINSIKNIVTHNYNLLYVYYTVTYITRHCSLILHPPAGVLIVTQKGGTRIASFVSSKKEQCFYILLLLLKKPYMQCDILWKCQINRL